MVPASQVSDGNPYVAESARERSHIPFKGTHPFPSVIFTFLTELLSK